MGANNLITLLDCYYTEDKCRIFLEELRWPNGVACPRCGRSLDISHISTRHTFDCLDCRYVFSVTSGTAFHKTRVPLRQWFIAVYLMCESKKGISANQLKRMFGVTYKTAWYLNHRIRNAISQAETPLLSNIVEVDETWVGGKVEGKGRGYTGNKAMVVGIVERNGKAILQIKEDRSRKTLHEFILDNVDDIDAILTDDWPAYRGLEAHHSVNHSAKQYVRRLPGLDVHTNTVENVWSLLKRSIIGTFHHVSVKHLDLYLDELAWKMNNRTPYLWEMTLRRLLESEHMSYEDLVA